MTEMTLRVPRLDELDALAALCFRSKGSWGYDADFMELCRSSLQIDPALVERGFTMVAESDGQVLGVAQVSLSEHQAALDLLFVDPDAFGRGVGRRLFDWAVGKAAEGGADTLGILADPDARPFYERMGAVFVRDAPSDVIPGRRLPWLERPLKPA